MHATGNENGKQWENNMKLWKVNHQLDHNKYLSQQKVCKTYVCKTHVNSYKSNPYIDQNLC